MVPEVFSEIKSLSEKDCIFHHQSPILRARVLCVPHGAEGQLLREYGVLREVMNLMASSSILNGAGHGAVVIYIFFHFLGVSHVSIWITEYA